MVGFGIYRILWVSFQVYSSGRSVSPVLKQSSTMKYSVILYSIKYCQKLTEKLWGRMEAVLQIYSSDI